MKELFQKVLFFVGSINRKYISLFFIFAITIAASLTFIQVQQNQDIRQRATGTATGPDLDVLYIERTPKYPWYSCINYSLSDIPVLCSSPTDKRWPDRDERVTFKAVIENKGNQDTNIYTYKWYIDGVEISSGTGTNLTPNQKAEFTQDWNWDHDTVNERIQGEHRIKFVADVSSTITEVSEQNNQIEEYTNAIPFWIFFEQRQANAFSTKVNRKGSYSPEDWFRDQFEVMIHEMENAGVTERFRIDKFVTVPDGQVDTVRNSNPDKYRIDAAWQFTCGSTADCERIANQFIGTTDWGLIHELGHQLGINHTGEWSIEEYFLNKVPDKDGRQLRITTSNKYPDILSYGLGSPGAPSRKFGEYTVKAINVNKGYRRGYYGEYMYDIPLENKIRALDINGQPLDNAQVKIYQKGGLHYNFPHLSFNATDGNPESTGTTDSSGLYLIPDRPIPTANFTTKTNHQVRPNPFGALNVNDGNANLVITIEKNGQFSDSYLDISAFNMTYWAGATATKTFDIPTLISQESLSAPTLSGLVENRQVRLSWSNVSGANRYFIYRSTFPDSVWTKIGETAASTYSQNFNDIASESFRYAIAAVDNDGKIGPISNVFKGQNFREPKKILIDEVGNRLVYNGEYLYAFYPDGNFLGKFATNHYRLFGGVSFTKGPTREIISGRTAFNYNFGGEDLREVRGYNTLPEHASDDIGTSTTYFVFTEKDQNRLVITDTNGNLITRLSNFGPYSLNKPKGISVADDTFYVADSENNRILILNYNPSARTASFVREITGLNRPQGVDTAGGFIAVADTGNNKIKLFRNDGTLVSEYTAPNDSYSGNFNSPRGVTILPGDPAQLIVADSLNQRVVIITTTTRIELSPPTPTNTPTPTPVPPTTTPTSVPTAIVTPTCDILPITQGNANNDCSIDGIDFNVWREEFLEIRTTRDADFNGDGVIDGRDFNIWRDSFLAMH